MAAGGSASVQAQRQRERALALMRQSRQAQAAAGRWQAAAAGERRVAAALLTLTGSGWSLLVDRRWPGTAEANVDMILVGSGGVFVIDVKNWRDAPEAVDGRLCAGGQERDREVGKLLAVTRLVEDALAEMQMSPVAVTPLMIFVGRSVSDRIGRVSLLGVHEALRLATGAALRLRPPVVRAVAAHLAEVFPAYEAPSVAEAAPAAGEAVPADAEALFDVDEVVQAQLRAALAKPVESWMTFLHPDQLALVRRRWNGPARISGAAGTGKTVVGLHRAAHLAHAVRGRVLYVTFVRNLPLVQQHLMTQLSPAVAARIEFTSLHGWAGALLDRRGVPRRLNKSRADSCFAWAWRAKGRGTCLEQLEPSPTYWQDEIAFVIKGRGITTLPAYQGVSRVGRRTALQPVHKRAVWLLFEEYERLRLDRGVHDFADILLAALAELRREPIDPAYTAVVADEVQDLTLTGVRILHAIIGDAPNGLLLIGDGQQAVYPGGFRLADAGIEIRGRSETLKVNYRNAADILATAMKVVEGEPFDDIDGSAVCDQPQVDLSYHDGRVVRVSAASSAEHDDALRQALQQVQATAAPADGACPLADTAVLCAGKREVEYYQRLLARAGLPVVNLDEYDGTPVAALKVGTFLRAKGLEFKYVFLPCFERCLDTARLGGSGDADRLTLARRQLFVGMTRARDLLWLGSVVATATAPTAALAPAGTETASG